MTPNTRQKCARTGKKEEDATTARNADSHMGNKNLSTKALSTKTDTSQNYVIPSMLRFSVRMAKDVSSFIANQRKLKTI